MLYREVDNELKYLRSSDDKFYLKYFDTVKVIIIGSYNNSNFNSSSDNGNDIDHEIKL